MENENKMFLTDKDNLNPGLIFDETRENEQNIINDIYTKSVEEKIYIILYKIIDESIEEEYRNIYSLCVGRTEVYNDIINKLTSGLDIDVNRSRIITETKQTESSTGNRKYYMLPYNECISVYAFCIQVKEFFDNIEFNIDDYVTTDIPEYIDEELKEHPMYLTAEQQNYREMLFAAMRRDSIEEMEEMKRANKENNI